MASELGLPQQPRGGGGRQKNAQAEARNRRVLGDIGNLVPVPAVEGKLKPQITRPITRGFGSQFLANAQAEAEKNSNKPISEFNGGIAIGGVVVGKDGAATKAVLVQKGCDKLKSKDVISRGHHEEIKSKEQNSVSGPKSRAASSRKTLTSILTARSKAASGICNKVTDSILNIDEVDIHDELAVVEYIEDIYNFYKLTEDESKVHDYMNSQPEINFKMRAILVDWLMEVHRKFELMPESLHLTINIVDRYLSMKTVSRRELQLVGISSMLIACKYEEIWPPEVNDFVAISDNAYVREQVLLMEKAILQKLDWYLTVPTPYVFLVRYIKASDPLDDEMENMVVFLAELGLMQYPVIINYCPSLLAASAVYAARCTLNKTPLWTETLKHYTGFSEDQLRDCAKLLVSCHSAAPESKLKSVYRKFLSPDRGAVALFPPAKNLLAAST